MSGVEDSTAVQRKLLKDMQAYIAAKDRLLVAHRTGSSAVANAAITKLDRLRDVPARLQDAIDD